MEIMTENIKVFTTKLLASKVGNCLQYRVSISIKIIRELNLNKGDEVEVTIKGVNKI